MSLSLSQQRAQNTTRGGSGALSSLPPPPLSSTGQRNKQSFLKSRSFAAQEIGGCGGADDAGPVGVIVRKSLATSERLDTVCVALKTIASMQNPLVTSLGPTLQKVVEAKIDRLNRIFDKLGESGENITLRFPPGELLTELDALIAEKEHQLGLALKSQQGGAALSLCELHLRGVCSSGVTCSYSHDSELLATYIRKWMTAVLRIPMGEDGEPLTTHGGGRGVDGERGDGNESSFGFGSVRADDLVSSTGTSEPASARNAAMLGATNPFSSSTNSPRKNSPLGAAGLGARKLLGSSDGSSFLLSSSRRGGGGGDPTPRRAPLIQSVLTVDCSFGPEAWSLILRSVHHYPNVTSLVLRSMPSQAVKLVCDLLQRNELERIAYLNLARNNIGAVYPKGTLRLARALLYNTSLTGIDLSFNKLGSAGALAISQSLCDGNGAIDSVNFGNNGIAPSEAAFGHWCRLLASNEHFGNKVRRLSLTGNRLGPDGAGLLLTSLASNMDCNALSHLDLYHTMMGDGGCRALASLLVAEDSCGPRLRVLNLGWNGITATGVQLLCASLESHRHLQILRLHGNANMGRKAAIALSLMLKAAADIPLRILDLRWTNPTDDGVASIAEAAASAKYLATIQLDHNELDPRSEALVIEKLRKRAAVMTVSSDVLVTPEDEVW